MPILNEEQKGAIKRQLHSSGSVDGFRCQGCDTGRVMEPTMIITLADSEGLRLIPLTCNSCGRVTFLNAESIGI
jgi:RNase P subunit RPR2